MIFACQGMDVLYLRESAGPLLSGGITTRSTTAAALTIESAITTADARGVSCDRSRQAMVARAKQSVPRCFTDAGKTTSFAVANCMNWPGRDPSFANRDRSNREIVAPARQKGSKRVTATGKSNSAAVAFCIKYSGSVAINAKWR